MSAKHVIEQIKNLSVEERVKVLEYVQHMLADADAADANGVVDDLPRFSDDMGDVRMSIKDIVDKS